MKVKTYGYSYSGFNFLGEVGGFVGIFLGLSVYDLAEAALHLAVGVVDKGGRRPPVLKTY